MRGPVLTDHIKVTCRVRQAVRVAVVHHLFLLKPWQCDVTCLTLPAVRAVVRILVMRGFAAAVLGNVQVFVHMRGCIYLISVAG